MINDTLKPTGELQIILRDENGNIKLNTTVPNLVVSAGKNIIASRLVGNTSSVMTHMAIGTSSTLPLVSHTGLLSEVSRAVLTSATSSLNEVNYTCTFGPSTAMAITEACILNAASGGSMLSRTIFSVVNKGIGDTLTINWKITIN
jgi:hypothetical protein